MVLSVYKQKKKISFTVFKFYMSRRIKLLNKLAIKIKFKKKKI